MIIIIAQGRLSKGDSETCHEGAGSGWGQHVWGCLQVDCGVWTLGIEPSNIHPGVEHPNQSMALMKYESYFIDAMDWYD